jgi:hypothetical protein
MNAFDDQMTRHQVRWRKANIRVEEWGKHNGKQYEYILPISHWEEALWPGIRSGSKRSLPDYLSSNQIQRHRDVNNLKSSWVLCANLYFPFGEGAGRNLLAGFLREHVHSAIQSVEEVELEYAGDGDLRPSSLLGEEGGRRGSGQTSPDVAFRVNRGRGLVLTESKFVEHSFYPCSACSPAGTPKRPGNPDPARCGNPLSVLADPAGQCHQAEWGRKYWKHLAPVFRKEKLSSLRGCPAAHAGYQLFRQQALAEGIAACPEYDLVISSVAVDERNETLRECLKDTGLTDIRQWGELFDGKAHFAVFSHQQWVAWVRARGDAELWRGWLNYVEARYGFLPVNMGFSP